MKKKTSFVTKFLTYLFLMFFGFMVYIVIVAGDYSSGYDNVYVQRQAEPVANPYVAGRMTQRNVCQTAGSLIRRNFGTHLSTARAECAVEPLGDNRVMISSGYWIQGYPQNEVRYVAQGYVRNGSSLGIESISFDGGSTFERF